MPEKTFRVKYEEPFDSTTFQRNLFSGIRFCETCAKLCIPLQSLRDHSLKIDASVPMPPSEWEDCREVVLKFRLFSVADVARGHLRQAIAVIHEEELPGEYMVGGG